MLFLFMRKWTFKIALATSIRQHALMPNLHVLKVLLKLLSLNPFKITFSQLIPNLREPLHPFSTHSHKPWRLGFPTIRVQRSFKQSVRPTGPLHCWADSPLSHLNNECSGSVTHSLGYQRSCSALPTSQLSCAPTLSADPK